MAFGRRRRYANRAPRAWGSASGAPGWLGHINWGSVGIAAAALAMVVLCVVFLVRGCSAPASTGSATPTPQAAGETASAAPTPTLSPQPLGTSEDFPLDLSQDVTTVFSAERNVNLPSIYGDELVYAAGSASANEPVFTKLYHLNLRTMEENQLTRVSIQNGEIHNAAINEDYIIWIDSNQIGNDKGLNRIYMLLRHPQEREQEDLPELDESGQVVGASQEEEEASPSPSPSAGATPSAAPSPTPAPQPENDGTEPFMIKENRYHMPQLKLYRDYLIWTEQDSEKTELLYLFDLLNQEDIGLPGYTESIEGFESVYGASAPDIYGQEVIWAAPDREDPNGRNSVIYSCHIDRLQEDDYAPGFWRAGMYVHDPITNGRAWAWIDRNHEPIQNLWIKYGEDARVVSEGTMAAPITSYCFGDDMLVYAKGGRIWVYFYETGQYGVLTPEGEKGMQPVANGRRIAWFGETVEGKDPIKVVYLP